MLHAVRHELLCAEQRCSVGKYSGPVGGLVVLVRLWQTHSPAVSADKLSAAPADETCVVSGGKTFVVSADKASLISQDIPPILRRQPQRGCVVNGVGMTWEIKDVLSVDTTVRCLAGRHNRFLACRHSTCLACRQSRFLMEGSETLQPTPPSRFQTVSCGRIRGNPHHILGFFWKD